MNAERRSDFECRERIQEIQTGYEEFTSTTAKTLTTVKRIMYFFVILGAVLTIAAAYLINDNRGRSNRINKSRATNLFNACAEQNARNENTKKVLHRVIKQSVESGRITVNGGAASEQFTILLINALAPHRNCSKLVLNQIKIKVNPVNKGT